MRRAGVLASFQHVARSTEFTRHMVNRAASRGNVVRSSGLTPAGWDRDRGADRDHGPRRVRG
ncbi:hypothetical protein Aph02nite_45810 [Actinoplanes philippinensis]|nr:hypothetical protein Aph02nite_45810 [Actinoplanes philippinensis]